MIKKGFCTECNKSSHALIDSVCPTCRDTNQPEIDALGDFFVEHQLHSKSGGEVSFEMFIHNPRQAILHAHASIS